MTSPAEEQPGQWLRDVRDRSSGPVRVQLSCDFTVGFPVEVFVDGHPGYVGPEMLGISDGLATDLTEFQRWWEAHSSFDDDLEDEDQESPAEKAEWRRWQEDGASLVERLKTELGPGFEVDWV